jgi:hypothetical protein
MGSDKTWFTFFCNCYKFMVTLNECGNSQENILQKLLELCKLKHPKHTSFTFINCWLVTKDAPRWANMWDDLKKPPPTNKCISDVEGQMKKHYVPLNKNNQEVKVVNIVVNTLTKWSQGKKKATKANNMNKLNENMQAQACATFKKRMILKKTNNLFHVKQKNVVSCIIIKNYINNEHISPLWCVLHYQRFHQQLHYSSDNSTYINNFNSNKDQTQPLKG